MFTIDDFEMDPTIDKERLNNMLYKILLFEKNNIKTNSRSTKDMANGIGKIIMTEVKRMRC